MPRKDPKVRKAELIKQIREIQAVQRVIDIKKARESLWDFQKVTDPASFKDEYTYLLILSLALESFWLNKPVSYQSKLDEYDLCIPDMEDCTFDVTFEKNDKGTLISLDISDSDVLIIECPPRHKKSYSLVLFEDWGLGKNRDEIFITCSHNKNISNRFSSFVRNGINQKSLTGAICYPDIFPETKIQHGNSKKEEWSIEGQHVSYVGGGIISGVTSMGGSLIIFDDLVKGAMEAFNENHLDKLWSAYADTWLSRLEKPYRQILVMTPWVIGDPGHRIQEGAKESGEVVQVLNFKAYSEKQNQDDPVNQGMLCPDVLDLRRYNILKHRVEESIFSANYNSKRIHRKGALYKDFSIYFEDDKPHIFEEIYVYIDTADQGSDWLFCGAIGVITDTEKFGDVEVEVKKGYMLDVYGSLEGMEVTEEETVDFLIRNHIQSEMTVMIESNNGGRGFARNVERILENTYPKQSRGIDIQWFTQSENKVARINAQSHNVMKYLYMPSNWRALWPEYYHFMVKYQKMGKNANDDAPDMTTGLAEHIDTEKSIYQILRRGY